MSNIIRWEPMREMVTLRDAMERLFDGAFTRPGGLPNGWRTSGAPAVDMYQTDNEVVINEPAPGMKAEDVKISVTGDMLTIKGEANAKSEGKEKGLHIREQRWGAFERSIALPTPVLADQAKAEFEDGVLNITLPKTEEVRPKTIAVKANRRFKTARGRSRGSFPYSLARHLPLDYTD